MKKFISGYLFFILTVLTFSEGIGDLDITITLTPTPPAKKYNINKSILLDAGDINSNKLENKIIKKIATVDVSMRTKPSKNEIGKVLDYCVLDGGDFTTGYKIHNLDLLAGEITTSDLIKYSGGQDIDFKLYQRDFKIEGETSENLNTSSEFYYFTAYPEKCKESFKGKNTTNIVSYFEYSFSIYAEIDKWKGGDIVRRDVSIGKTSKVDVEADGALKDLVKQQFDRLK